MRVARPVLLNAEQREVLEQRAGARSLPARVVERSRIVLLAAEAKQDLEIAATLKITPRRRHAGAPGFFERVWRAWRKTRRGRAARPGSLPSWSSRSSGRRPKKSR